MHSTNYFNTLIQVAEDCPAKIAEVPPDNNSTKTVASLQFSIIYNNPYAYTSDDVLFKVFAIRNSIREEDYPKAKKQFFSKSYPCFRSSPFRSDMVGECIVTNKGE
jgi:hypothetical protein